MKPKAKKIPKPEPSTLGYCGMCCQKRYGVGGRCLICNTKLA